MKKKVLATIMAAAMSLTMLVGCGSEGGGDATAPETDAGGEATAEAGDAGEAPAADGDVITVGFAQVGHESDWRTASTTSVKAALSNENGIESLSNYKILKMTLQPLVENALYHGIKNKRGKGLIRITGKKEDKLIRFEVSDDGVGIDDETLRHIRKELNKPAKDTDTGFGMANVNERIKMNFGDRYGICIESELGSGTTVSVVIPAIAYDHDEEKDADK